MSYYSTTISSTYSFISFPKDLVLEESNMQTIWDIQKQKHSCTDLKRVGVNKFNGGKQIQTLTAENLANMVSWKVFLRRSRHDICHKHHKQRLCKIIPTLGKICYGKQMYGLIVKKIV